MSFINDKDKLVGLEKSTPGSIEPDTNSLSEERQYLAEKRKHELQELFFTLRARKIFANIIIAIVIVWLIAIYIIVVLSGLGRVVLSDVVLVALISTTTINIIALLAIITRNLFPGIKI